jgi:hypothetical protein
MLRWEIKIPECKAYEKGNFINSAGVMNLYNNTKDGAMVWVLGWICGWFLAQVSIWVSSTMDFRSL